MSLHEMQSSLALALASCGFLILACVWQCSQIIRLRKKIEELENIAQANEHDTKTLERMIRNLTKELMRRNILAKAFVRDAFKEPFFKHHA